METEWIPYNSKLSSAAARALGGAGGFNYYEFHAPHGIEIFGFFGRSGDEIDAIWSVPAPSLGLTNGLAQKGKIFVCTPRPHVSPSSQFERSIK